MRFRIHFHAFSSIFHPFSIYFLLVSFYFPSVSHASSLLFMWSFPSPRLEVLAHLQRHQRAVRVQLRVQLRVLAAHLQAARVERQGVQQRDPEIT